MIDDNEWRPRSRKPNEGILMLRLKSELIWTGFLAAVVACATAARADETAAPAAEPAAHAADHRAPAAGGPLAPLEWLLGEWTGLTDHATVLVSAHWCEDGAFIEREFVVQHEGLDHVGGTQRIGWDPLTKLIKCWTFDSLGGVGESYWRPEGDTWIVESSEVLADGGRSTTKTVLTPKGADRFLWEVESANVEGAELPKQKIEFVRADKE
jgi:hypothetical protein